MGAYNKDMSDVKNDIKNYLDEARMMQLATVRDNKPWVCNVWTAVDKDLTIYWISATTRRHSQEIKDNQHVAAAFCLVNEPKQTAKGALQLEGTAHEVTNPLEIAKALKLYVARGIFTSDQVKKFMKSLDMPHKFYKLAPTRIVLFDGNSHEYTL